MSQFASGFSGFSTSGEEYLEEEDPEEEDLEEEDLEEEDLDRGVFPFVNAHSSSSSS